MGLEAISVQRLEPNASLELATSAMATRRSAIELPPLIWRPHQELHLGRRLCRPLHRCSAMWSKIGCVGRSRTCDLRVNSSALLPAELLPNEREAASITSFGEMAALKTDSPVLGMAAVSWYDHNTLLGASRFDYGALIPLFGRRRQDWCARQDSNLHEPV